MKLSLCAGSQLNHLQTLYRADAPPAVAVGLKKAKDEQKEFNAEWGWLTVWQPVDKNLGMQGLAVLVNAGDVDKLAEDARNNLLVMKPRTSFPVSYWAGFAGTAPDELLPRRRGRNTLTSLPNDYGRRFK